MTGAELQLLEALLTEIRGLRADLRATRRQPIDPATLLATIAQCAGDRNFTAAELVRHSRYAKPLAELLGGMPPKKIGKLLRQIEGQDFSGYRIVRLALVRDGVLWRCEFGDQIR